MGMFDYVSSKKKLPSVIIEGKKYDPTHIVYQTKSLENCLLHYSISEDGKLLCEGNDIDYHGYVHFYTYKNINEQRYWLHFDAKFTDGYLVDIQPSVKPY
jgi:hypothetical protein